MMILVGCNETSCHDEYRLRVIVNAVHLTNFIPHRTQSIAARFFQ